MSRHDVHQALGQLVLGLVVTMPEKMYIIGMDETILGVGCGSAGFVVEVAAIDQAVSVQGLVALHEAVAQHCAR